MGIWKPTNTPIPLEPVDIFTDTSYADGARDVSSRPRWTQNLTVQLRLHSDPPEIAVGDQAFITCNPGGRPQVLVVAPFLRPLGELYGPGAEIVAEFIRTAHTGLGGILGFDEVPDSVNGLIVKIPGDGEGR